MFYRSRHFALGVSVGLSLVVLSSPVRADIDLEWRPVSQEACTDDLVEIELYAVSDTGYDQSISTVVVILWWDSDVLELVGKINNGGYNWFYNAFPDDGDADNLNPPLVAGVPANDGNALYHAWRRYGNGCGPGQNEPCPPAWATPQGLRVVTFRFRMIDSTVGQLAMLPVYGNFSTTHVTDGYQPGDDVTGVLGPPSSVRGCRPPTVQAEGPRYLAVTPYDCDSPVALIVTGDPGDQDVSCVASYVQADGSLGDTSVAMTPAEWGTVHVFGNDIIPSKTYRVWASCGESDPVMSLYAADTTWQWGDVNNLNNVDLDDVLQLLDAYQNIFNVGTLENSDLYGWDTRCGPDRQIDLDDILAVLDAYQFLPYSCGHLPPCP